jgi:hypothetical protein
MQTFSLEYIVLGSLDGVTPAPAFSVDPNADNYLRPGKDQLYTQVVQNLGVIDPDFGAGGAQGNRLLTWVWVYGPTAGVPGAEVAVADAQGTELTQQQVIDLAGKTQAYLPRAQLVPQASRIRVSGMSASPGQPVIVRFNVLVADTVADVLALCACASSGGDAPTGGIDVQDEGTPVVDDAAVLNFIGAGVTAAPNGTTADITIPGGVNVEETGSAVLTPALTLNFLGAGVTAVANGTTADITIPGGAGVSGATNIGTGEEVFAANVGGVLEFRTLVAGANVSITQSADELLIAAEPALQSTSFADSPGVVLVPLAPVSAGFLEVNLSLFNTVANIQTSYQIIVGCDGTNAAADILQVDANPGTPLLTVTPGVSVSGGNINLNFTNTGAGETIQARYTVTSIPRI